MKNVLRIYRSFWCRIRTCTCLQQMLCMSLSNSYMHRPHHHHHLHHHHLHLTHNPSLSPVGSTSSDRFFRNRFSSLYLFSENTVYSVIFRNSFFLYIEKVIWRSGLWQGSGHCIGNVWILNIIGKEPFRENAKQFRKRESEKERFWDKEGNGKLLCW